MTITVTDKGYAGAGQWGSSVTTAGFTSTTDGLLVALCWFGGTSGTSNGTPAVSDSETLTWTKQVEHNGRLTAYQGSVAIYTAPVSSGTSGHTVTLSVTAGGSISWCELNVVELTGDVGSIEQTFTDDFAGGSAGGYSDDFASALDSSDSLKLLAAYAFNNPSSAFVCDSGWTEIVEKEDSDITSAHFPHLIACYDTGTTDTGIDIDTVPTGTSSYDHIVVAIEVSDSGGGGGGGNTITTSIAETGDTIAASLNVINEIAVAIAEAGDTITSSITVLEQISAAINEAGDSITASIVGPGAGRTVTASIAEAGDTLSAGLNNLVNIVANVVEDGDTVAANFTLLQQIVASIDEEGDTISASVTSPRNLTVSINEQGDVIEAYLVDPSSVVDKKKIPVISAQTN